MKILAAVMGVFLLVALASCGAATSKQDSVLEGQGVPPRATAPAMGSPAAPNGKETSAAGGHSFSLASAPIDRMIVKSGYLTMVVEDVTVAIERIVKIAEGASGYVVSSNSWREGERLRGTITIRVPAGEFGNLMSVVSALAVEVTVQTTTSQDVTEEYVDLDAKLKNLQATEQQLLRIMEKGEKVEDILAVQRELTNTRAQIEQTKGRMQYLEKTAATSLIEVSLEQSKLDAKFTVDRRFIKSGESVRFSSQVAGGFAPYSYQWDFGDSKTSNEAAPVHVYRGTGEHTVVLTVTDDRGNSASATMKDYVSVQAGWSAGNVAGSAWNGLAAFGRALASIGIWLGVFSPVWIVGGGIAFWRLRRRSKRSK
jgi:hypothetical protein